MARSKNSPQLKNRHKAVVAAPEHPWDRQPGEPDSSWANFLAYRDMPPAVRSQEKAAHKVGKNPQTIGCQSQRWDWVARVRACDMWKDKQTQIAEIQSIQDMRRRHIQMAMSFQGAAALALNKIIQAEREGSALTLKPGEVKELAELGIKIERLNRGEPETITEDRVVPDAKPSTPNILHDYTKLSRDELRELRALVTRARHGRK